MFGVYLDVDRTLISGAGAMNGTLGATITSAPGGPDKRLVRFTSNTHGLLSGSIMLPDVATYNGLRKIDAVAASTFDLLIQDLAYTAVTPAGTELWYAGYTSKNKWDLVGFLLHLSSIGLTDENLTVTVDANAGAAYDWKPWDDSMLGKTDIIWMPDIPIPMEANDILKFAYTNTDASTWGIKILTRPSENR